MMIEHLTSNEAIFHLEVKEDELEASLNLEAGCFCRIANLGSQNLYLPKFVHSHSSASPI